MTQIDDFISKLSLIKKSYNTTNLYFGDSIDSKIRRHNLKIYLNKMLTLNPQLMVLGEAPGYKGCRLSGIAFTSERILSGNMFFKNEPFQFINPRNKLEGEISATIVWDAISKLNVNPVIWNIYPFHPHVAENTKSNRTPTKIELEEGKHFLCELLRIFDIKKIIAVGRKAESQITGIGLPFSYIRHPANRGKVDFLNGFSQNLSYENGK